MTEKVFELRKAVEDEVRKAVAKIMPKCADCISRQAALDEVESIVDTMSVCISMDECRGMRRMKKSVLERIEALPSAQRWIPVTERLPEEPFGCIVTVWDTNPFTMDEFENVLPYFVGWDGEQWNDGDGELCPFEVIAWMPLPESWKG